MKYMLTVIALLVASKVESLIVSAENELQQPLALDPARNQSSKQKAEALVATTKGKSASRIRSDTTLSLFQYKVAVDRENILPNITDFNISEGLSCPTWTFPTQNHTCECGSELNGAIHCNYSLHQLAIHSFYCMTYDESMGVTVAGKCSYNGLQVLGHALGDMVPLPLNVYQLNNATCGHLYRTGQLCGQCKEGHKPPAYFYSYKCAACDGRYKWLKYIVIAFVPLTLFLLVIFCLRVSATSAQLNAFVFFSQVISIPLISRGIMDAGLKGWQKAIAQVLITFYSIWNLDFFRTVFSELCLDLSFLQVTALDYAIAFYPLLLMIIFYVLIESHDSNYRPIVYMWKPFYRCLSRFRRQWNVRASTVDAFATFLLLSYVKLLSVSANILVPTWVYDVHGRKIGLYLYHDATIKYFSKEHLPYAILAAAVCFTFILAPLLLLILYPMRCFQRCLGCFNASWHALHTFNDAFHGCYKNGTNGTRDYRYFAAVYLAVRIIMYILFAALKYSMIEFWEGILLLSFSISIMVAQPYKLTYSIYNTIDAILILLLAAWFLTIVGMRSIHLPARSITLSKVETLLALSVLIALLPLVYLFFIIFHWLCCHTVLKDRCFSRIFPQRRATQSSLPHRMVNPSHYNEEIHNSGGDGEEYEPLLSMQ